MSLPSCYIRILFYLNSVVQLNAAISSFRGCPSIDELRVLDGILWKLSHTAPWYDMPSSYPSHQFCYRQWQRSGLLDEIKGILYRHLQEHAGFNILEAMWNERFLLRQRNSRWMIYIVYDLLDTWQLIIIILLFRDAVSRLSGDSSPRSPFPRAGGVQLE